MAIGELLAWYNLGIGLLASVGLVYLVYIQRVVLENRRFLLITTLGLLTFTVFGPLVEILAREYVHIVHGLAALFVIFGLYDPVHNDLRKDEWANLLFKEPEQIRNPAGWMVPMDDEILTLFHRKDLVLTPAIVAYNIDRSRESVNRRLSELEACGLVDRVQRGKYRITSVGVEYMDGARDWTCMRDAEAAGDISDRDDSTAGTAVP